MLLDSAPLHILLSVSCCNCASVLFTLRAYVNKANSDCDSEVVRRTQRMFTDVEKRDMHRGKGKGETEAGDPVWQPLNN